MKELKELELLERKLLLLDGNETNLLSRVSEENFRKIIVEILRIKYGMRYHEYDRECKCQPECIIKELLENSELKEFLEQNGVIEYITRLLENPINKNVTVWGE